MRVGIHIRLLAGAIGLIFATTFILGYMGIQISQQFLRSRFEDRISFLGRYLALNSEVGILLDDRAMLERLARNLLAEKDVMAVSIFGTGETELARIVREPGRGASVVETPVLLQTQEEIQAFEPGTAEASREIGRVRIAYSTESIEQLARTMRNRFVWLSGGLALVAAIIFFFLSRSLVAPVSGLARAAREIARGNLNLRAGASALPETQELASAFNAMLDSLERNRKALEEANEKITRQRTLAEMGKFSLMVAHEVKNPLSIIKSSLDVLKKDPGFHCDDVLVFYMEDEIRRLNRLIEDFLAFAHPVKTAFRTVDLNRLLEEVVTRFRVQHADAGIPIRSRLPVEPCYAEADSDLLARALGNILRNAVEASGDQGRVEVSAERDDGTWSAVVEDEGAGIENAHLDKIFEPFFTTRSKGTGLGLAYAEQVVRSHGGSIAAGNRSERGAVFRIRIPIAPAAAGTG